MAGLTASVWAEALKARRSLLPGLTALGFSLAPLVGGLFLLIRRDPAWARRFGLLTTKAELQGGTADWPAAFDLLAQTVAVGGLIVFGLVVIWLFGREYGDGTVTDLLALPTPRWATVTAKFAIAAAWSALLTAWVVALGLAVGAAIGLPGWSGPLLLASAGRLVVVAGLTLALVAPLAWVASAGRGYLPAVGAVFLVVVLAQVVAALGWGASFPWWVPALASGVAGPDVRDVGVGSYVGVVLTGVVGVASTLAWWQYADQT